MAGNAAVGAVMPGPGVTPGSVQQQAVPFRRATVERVETLAADSPTQTTATQRIDRVIEGSGFVYGIFLDVRYTTASNTAAVAFYEDAPWSMFDTVVFRDVNGELVNLSGFSLFVASLANRQYAVRDLSQSSLAQLVQGSAGTGGSLQFGIRVPVGNNRRDLLGVLGNQDRAQKYSLRNDIASGGAATAGPVFTTAPTTLATVNVNKYYENYSVPLPVSPNGAPQQVFPPGFGTLHFTTQNNSDAAPSASATINHYIRRIGNTIRWIGMIFRSGSTATRATADAQFVATTQQYSSQIRFKVGEDTLFNESYAYRRYLMYERFGFEFPVGVLLYDAIHDFAAAAGSELGDDYYHTQALVNAQFQVSYPSGISGSPTLTFVVDDLIYVPPVVGVAAAG